LKDVYEIHKYQNGQFQYVVARTNKHTEEKVKTDVEKMNNMLSEEFKSQGINYTFALGTMADYMKNLSKRQKERVKGRKGVLLD
jgi:3-methyladenine DNA glycosylase AlkD